MATKRNSAKYQRIVTGANVEHTLEVAEYKGNAGVTLTKFVKNYHSEDLIPKSRAFIKSEDWAAYVKAVKAIKV